MGRTDATDLGILRELTHPALFQWDVRITNADIARKLGVDEETVRLRLKRMQERGFVRGFDVGLNPGVLGCDLVRIQVAPIPDRRQAAADALSHIDGARLVFQHYSGALSLVAYAPADRPRDRLVALVGAVAGPPVSVTTFRVPPPSFELDETDWRVVAALRKDPRAGLADLASAGGLSERTLRRRLERLVEGRTLILDVDVDFSRMEGALPAMFTVRMAPGASRGDVGKRLDALPDVLFRVDAGDEARVSCLARSLPAVDALRRELAGFEGVADVSAELYLDRHVCRAWLDEEVARARHRVYRPGTPFRDR